jgi:hypothetical protein
MKPAVRAVAFVAMAGALCTSYAALAEDAAKSPPPEKAGVPATGIPATGNAMRVVVDPETGEVRAPTADELQALVQAQEAAQAAASSARSARAAAPAASTQVLPAENQVVRHANGATSVRLGMDSLSLVKIESDATGKAQTSHVGETRLPQEDK